MGTFGQEINLKALTDDRFALFLDLVKQKTEPIEKNKRRQEDPLKTPLNKK